MRKLGLCLVLALLLPCAAQASEEEQWAPWLAEHDKNGLQLETRKNQQTGVLETRATARLGCTTDRLWELLTNNESFLRLMPDMLESRPVKGQDAHGEGWWYQRISKAPISDRDYTLHVQWTIEESALGRKYFRWWSIDGGSGPAPKENVLRLHTNNGSWSFLPVEGARTDFTYINYVELEGSLWKVITNRAAKSNAIEFLQNLQEECR
jgi:hypothetical protein